MKEGWTYKTIEDACSINYGTRVVQKKDKGSTYYVYGGGGATFMIDRYNREDCFIVSRFAMSPKCTRYVEGKFFLNDSGLSVSTNDEGFLCQKFLDKVLLANNDNIYAMGKGMAQRNLDMPSFRKLIIPIPPIEEQERIVAELDLLQGIIEKKKEQLKAYDQLAQSIFYSMFGDPIDNPKGWETTKLKDITTKIGSGATPKGGNQSYKNEGISLIRSLNVHNGSFKYEDLAHIDEQQAHQLNNVIVEENDVLFNITGASVARCCIVPFDVLPARVNQHVSILRPKKEIVNHVYLCYYLISPNSQNALLVMSKSNAATREALPKSMMEKYSICVPPLSLQQEFAEKVEAIERQKALVQQSIVETQTMFDCTMDKYFG